MAAGLNWKLQLKWILQENCQLWHPSMLSRTMGNQNRLEEKNLQSTCHRRQPANLHVIPEELESFCSIDMFEHHIIRDLPSTGLAMIGAKASFARDKTKKSIGELVNF